MGAGITVAGLIGALAVIAIAVVTWLLADTLDAVDDAFDFSEGVKTDANSGRGSGTGAGLHSSHKDSPSSHSGRGDGR